MIDECGPKLFHDSMKSVVLQAVCVILSKYKGSCQTKGGQKCVFLSCGPEFGKQVGSSMELGANLGKIFYIEQGKNELEIRQNYLKEKKNIYMHM